MSLLTKSVVLGGLVIFSIFMMNSCKPKGGADGKLTAGIRLENLDTTAVPGTDFYQFATGGWQKLNPISGEYSRYGSFDKLGEDNRNQLKGLIEEIASKPAPNGSVEQKIADLFNLAMDSAKLNKDGMEPIKADLEKISDLKDTKELVAYLPVMMQEGYSPFFHLYVDADPMNSNAYLVQTYQGGMGLGQRDYYLENDDNTKNIRARYGEFIAKMFEKQVFLPKKLPKNAMMFCVLKIVWQLPLMTM